MTNCPCCRDGCFEAKEERGSSREGAFPFRGATSSWTKEEAIDEGWQSIRSEEQSIEIELHSVVEKESISSMAEHSISTATSTTFIECKFVCEAFSSPSIEESLSSIECLAVTIECQAATIECKAVTIECQAATIECQAATIECQAVTIECQAVAIECQAVAIECQAVTIEC
jgi:hypothetical protein